MIGQGDGGHSHATPSKICARRGCGAAVKKRTAKYCSIRCCSIDPERHERLRLQARRANARPLPMTRQMTLSMSDSSLDPEAQLAEMGEGREDIPAGMSRFAG